MDESKEKAERLKALGNSLLTKKDYQGAIDSYTDALELLPLTIPRDVESPSLRSILLSNRSAAYLKLSPNKKSNPSYFVNKALTDANQCASESPAWPKAHVRRAAALLRKSNGRREALEAYDDAIAAAKREKNPNLVKEIQAARKKCARDTETGSTDLAEEVKSMGNLLAVPDDATIDQVRVLRATLDRASYNAIDDRNNMPIQANFPGDAAWPMVVPTLIYKSTGKYHPFPLCYYVIGPCTLTNACVKEIGDIFRPKAQYACRWPEGKATQTCPFCAGFCRPGPETYTMVFHLLIGQADQGFGQKLMMQLVCSRCTDKHLRTAQHRLKGETKEDAEGFQKMFDNDKSGYDKTMDPLPRLMKLTDRGHAIKASTLWNRASNTALTSSITLHAQERITKVLAQGGVDLTYRHNTGSHNAVVTNASGETESFFETWISGLDIVQLDSVGSPFASSCKEDPMSLLPSPVSSSPEVLSNRGGECLHSQDFGIQQVARIKDLQKALGLFWKKHGSEFRLEWSTWDNDERKAFTYETAKCFVESNTEHYNRRHTQYHLIEDLRNLVNKPFGRVKKDSLSFFPEVAGTAFLDEKYDLLQLFRDRTAKEKTWVAEDVALIAQLKKENRLPKLQLNEKDGSYLCDYMGLEDSSIGPFVVLVGEREAEYDADGKLSSNLFTPDEVVKLREYHSLDEPFAENVNIFFAYADGPVRTSLNKLIEAGTATDAVCYIYAAMRQVKLLEYLQKAAQNFFIYIGKDNPKEMDRWSYEGLTSCYVCAARTQANGKPLFSCSKCHNLNYCSRECQVKDWKRHKAESCIPTSSSKAKASKKGLGSGSAQNQCIPTSSSVTEASPKVLGSGSAQNRKKKGKKGKGSKKKK